MVVDHMGRHRFHVLIQPVHEFLGFHFFRDRGEADEVCEQYREDHAFRTGPAVAYKVVALLPDRIDDLGGGMTLKQLLHERSLLGFAVRHRCGDNNGGKHPGDDRRHQGNPPAIDERHIRPEHQERKSASHHQDKTPGRQEPQADHGP